MKKHNDFEELIDLVSLGSIESIEKYSSKINLSRVRIGEFGLSLLHFAAWNNRPEICKYLIKKGVDPEASEKFSGKTALHFAAYLGNIEVVIALIESGAEGLITNKSVDCLACHPIHYAAMIGNKEMIDFFLNLPNFNRRERACSIASQSCLGNILDIFIRKRNYELLDYYSPIGGVSAIETNPRLYSDLYIGYRNEYQWSSIHYAAVMGDLQSLEILLKHFPNPTCLQEEYRKHYFFSPGEVAIAEGHIQVAKLLNYDVDVTSYRDSLKIYALRKDEPEYMLRLANAIIERDKGAINDFLDKYGVNILSKKSFKTDNTQYYEKVKFNAFSIACRCFALSFLSHITEKNIEVPALEFTKDGGRDIVEIPFFNWALMDVNPFGEEFFEKISKSLFLSNVS